jgi:dTDP-4-amino-4,6-dideoxygalactose transaminase
MGIPVIEDCSQSYGTCFGADSVSSDGVNDAQNTSTGNGVLVESGIFAILGLEERDMLTSGGGALLFSMNRRDSAALRSLGELPPEYALPDMNAALAVVQFREAAKNLQRRREIARLYTQSALRTQHKSFIQPDIQSKPIEYNNYAFALVLETGMNDVKAYARRKDIVVESAFEDTLIGKGLIPKEKCPEAYSLSLRTVLFPIYPRLGLANAGKLAKLIQTLP